MNPSFENFETGSLGPKFTFKFIGLRRLGGFENPSAQARAGRVVAPGSLGGVWPCTIGKTQPPFDFHWQLASRILAAAHWQPERDYGAHSGN